MAPIRPTEPTLVRCFVPFYGITAGALIGWFAMYSPEQDISAHEWLGRLQAITNSLLMWSLFTALLQEKEVFGGGLVKRTEESVGRLLLLGIFLLLVWAVALIAFLKGLTIVFVLSTGLMICLLFGEVGWRDPIRIYNAFLGR